MVIWVWLVGKFSCIFCRKPIDEALLLLWLHFICQYITYYFSQPLECDGFLLELDSILGLSASTLPCSYHPHFLQFCILIQILFLKNSTYLFDTFLDAFYVVLSFFDLIRQLLRYFRLCFVNFRCLKGCSLTY